MPWKMLLQTLNGILIPACTLQLLPSVFLGPKDVVVMLGVAEERSNTAPLTTLTPTDTMWVLPILTLLTNGTIHNRFTGGGACP